LNSKLSFPAELNLDPARLPKHVAIIMDGNGRWAKQRLLNRIKGHEKGSKAVRVAVETCCEAGIPVLTLFAFSTENWQRPASEVEALMVLLRKFLVTERDRMLENGVRLNAIGQIHRLPESVRSALTQTMQDTRHCDRLLLNLALSYGGRSEIVAMAKTIAQKAANGEIEPDTVNEDIVGQHLYTAGIPDPDLLIRTSGEMRISNFLLWQIAYAEIYVTPTFWPDFGREELLEILRDFQKRERRFGKL
jgi:undecaprenyl diphosphate synthase